MEQDAMSLLYEESGEITIVAISFFTENLINYAKDNFDVTPEQLEELEVYFTVEINSFTSLHIHTAPFV